MGVGEAQVPRCPRGELRVLECLRLVGPGHAEAGLVVCVALGPLTPIHVA